MDVAFGGRGKLDMPSPHPLSAACFQREDVPAGRCPTTLDHLWGTTLFFSLPSSFFYGGFSLWRAADPDRCSKRDPRSSAL